MPTIQIGLDLATSLSVIGAAFAFIYAQFTQGRKSRRQAFRTQRIEHMSRICSDLAQILVKGDEVVARVRMAESGRELNVTTDDFTNFCIEVERYIRINTSCSFNVWATEQEKSILDSLAKEASEWNKKLVSATVAKYRGEAFSVPSFVVLIEDLTAIIKSFSVLVREEVARFDA